jgi:thiamine kinase-like enzyme
MPPTGAVRFMSTSVPNERIFTNLLEHPAVVAWRELRPKRLVPDSIEVLKTHRKSAIYRLEGVGSGGTAVIAKRCRTASAAIERTIYEEILPYLPVASLHFYGLIDGADDEFDWLFLEDAGEERFSPASEEHRTLAAQWLGRMHSTAARLAAAARLPDRGSNHYLEHLRYGRDTIRRNLTNPVLTADDRATLEAIMAQCDVLEQGWSQIERVCADMPLTLVHGDFRSKNARIGREESGKRLFALDWETAGWGVPAADLAPTHGLSSSPQIDLSTYESIVREYWPGVDLPAIRQLVTLGTIFRRLAAISWESLGLAYEWREKPMTSMQVYQAQLAEALQTLPWERSQ